MSIDFEGVENDPAAVTEALRRLVEVGALEDAALIERVGGWPERLNGPTASPIASFVIHPVRSACTNLMEILTHHLGTLIGEAAARDQYAALVAEQRASPDVRASLEKLEQGAGKPHPSAPTTVH